MEFRDLKKQYRALRKEINGSIQKVLRSTDFIQGSQVNELEDLLADYVGVKHCITCGNGTDALQLALMTWGVGKGDAVFVPDFTFFASAEVIAMMGATPVFVDVRKETFNIGVEQLGQAIRKTLKNGRLNPRAVVAVDLFGQSAEYEKLRELTDQYGLLLLEDGAQGFGGAAGGRRNCSFGDISATSFFPAKPLGCYGDGGAIFTDNDEWDELVRSLRVHGKGESKYENVRIGMNSRLDTVQAAVLLAKFRYFTETELEAVNRIADLYTAGLAGTVKTPVIKQDHYSSWAQYTIRLRNAQERDGLQRYLKKQNIPSMIYYPEPMHRQKAFMGGRYDDQDFVNTIELCDTVLSLPIHPYLETWEAEEVITKIKEYMKWE
jgi:dTDP-4-amino-4,6-dideoxygalactose transaminase